MKRKILKATNIFLSLLLIINILCTTPCVYAGRAYNWYCKKNDSHTVPELDPEFDFIGKYGGFYANLNVKDGDKVIYLTFDAGYENGNVAKILDVLKDHSAHASFFVLENLITRNPELIMRMKDEGHLVCNHTAKHPDMTKIINQDVFAQQLTNLENAYLELTGEEMAKVYRPPEGRFSEENLKFAHELGYKTIFWSFAYADWDNNRQPDSKKSLEKLLSHTHNGEILLLHPTSSTNAEIMDEFLCCLEKQGYRFGELSELWAR